jgi:flagellar motor component MotA
MDTATGLGLLAGAVVLATLILIGGDLRMFLDAHAAIVIFGGSFAATLIRFPLSSIFHGLPLGAKFAFSLRRMSQRDLVDELAGLAEVARKSGPIGLEKVEIEDPKVSVSPPTATTATSFATTWNATATIFSRISTKGKKSIAQSAIARLPLA